MNNKIEQKLNKLIIKAKKNNEVPIACVITYKDRIIASAYNKVNKKNDIINHAEVICLKKATKKLNNWRLNECNLYVTLEPCDMCKEIIKKYRINNVYYFVKQNNYKTESQPNYIYRENKYYLNILKNFFKDKR